MSDSYTVVLTTAGNNEEAKALASGLVEAGLIACAQLLPMESVYRWEGSVQQESEVLLLLKARADNYDAIEAFILENHSYDTPEVIQLPVLDGSASYLAWIDEVSHV